LCPNIVAATEHANALIKMLKSKFEEGIIESGRARQYVDDDVGDLLI